MDLESDLGTTWIDFLSPAILCQTVHPTSSLKYLLYVCNPRDKRHELMAPFILFDLEL